MSIRVMTIDDYDELYALWHSCSGMGLNNLDDSREGIKKFLSRNPESCFVAVESTRIIGAILAGNDGRRGYIYHTAVAADYRRQGTARQLVDSVIEALRKCGINKVALLVFRRNEPGNAFWESMGFTERDDIVYRSKTLTEMIRIDT